MHYEIMNIYNLISLYIHYIYNVPAIQASIIHFLLLILGKSEIE